MRTTLDISDDVLFAAKAEARDARKPLGQVVSELARKGLQVTAASRRGRRSGTAAKLMRLGIHVLPERGEGAVTNELVDRIRDDEGI